jgi:hypothetical protein
MLDLNPYKIIFKITHVSTVVVGSKFTSVGFVLMRVLGAVMHSDRDVSPHPHVSRVVDDDPSGFEFYLFLLSFHLRCLAAHSDGASSADVGVVFLFYYSELYIILYYYYFIYFVIGLFYSFSLPYACLVVRSW